LLQIKSARTEDSIEFRICTVSVDSTPEYPYIALSYAWGDLQHTCPIICDGKRLHVTQNLKDALWQLRQSLPKFAGLSPVWGDSYWLPYLWIDAICINQSDDEEKSNQVALMWDIYNRAELVIAWLGKHDESSRRELELIRYMNSVVASNEQSYRKIRVSELATLGLPGLVSPQWNTLFSVLSRDWFSRVWVIQELVAATMCIFLCGDESIDSSILCRVGKIIEENKLLSSIRNFDRTRILAVNVNCLAGLKLKRELDFNTLLWSTHMFKASDQRDRIFSLIHMASGLTFNTISELINYRLSTHEVLTKCACISLVQDSLDVLCYAQAFGDLYSLPSWVPHWTAPDFCYTPLLRSWEASKQIATTRGQYYQVEPNDVSGYLICQDIDLYSAAVRFNI
jgi:hypothetical protein